MTVDVLTVGVTLIGGLAVLIVVVCRLGRFRFGYKIPRIEGWGVGYKNRGDAVEEAGRAVDRYTEVDWDE